MKKVLFATIALLGLNLASFAQAAPAKKAETAKKPAKVVTMTKHNTTVATSSTPTKPSHTATVVKQPTSASVSATKPAASVKEASVAKSTTQHLKKDGTPDKRYKQNQHLKKDGTPDKRFKENKK